MEDSIKKPLCGSHNWVLYSAQYGGWKKNSPEQNVLLWFHLTFLADSAHSEFVSIFIYIFKAENIKGVKWFSCYLLSIVAIEGRSDYTVGFWKMVNLSSISLGNCWSLPFFNHCLIPFHLHLLFLPDFIRRVKNWEIRLSWYPLLVYIKTSKVRCDLLSA